MQLAQNLDKKHLQYDSCIHMNFDWNQQEVVILYNKMLYIYLIFGFLMNVFLSS